MTTSGLIALIYAGTFTFKESVTPTKQMQLY